MTALEEIFFLLRISRSRGIVRRYFVTNGFDGALAMLGLIMGFYVSGGVPLGVAISVCLSTAIALAVSGLSSAYISEMAERRRELHQLERAMVADLGGSAYGRATRLVPLIIALVNGLAPLCIALVIVAPLALARLGVSLPLAPLEASIVAALGVIFLLGVFLSRVGRGFWLWSGLRAIAIALFTALLILVISP